MTVVHHPPESLGPIHPPNAQLLGAERSNAQHITIKGKDPLDQEAPAILHLPPNFDPAQANGAAVVLISGAGGGVSGPSGIYPSLAEKFALLLSIPCVRLDYRDPGHPTLCTADMLATFSYLSERFSSSKFVLVGWSFVGCPCFTVAARDQVRVWGVATIASQTAGTSGIKELSPRPVMLLHGTGDTVLSSRCSQNLYQEYGSAGERELHFFEGDDHGLTNNAPKAETMIFDFAAKCLGLEGLLTRQVEEKAEEDLVGSKEERIKEMQAGRDLEGGERI